MFQFVRAVMNRPLKGKGPYAFAPAPVRGNDWPARMAMTSFPMIREELDGAGYMVRNFHSFTAPAIFDGSAAIVKAPLSGSGRTATFNRVSPLLIDPFMGVPAFVGKDKG